MGNKNKRATLSIYKDRQSNLKSRVSIKNLNYTSCVEQNFVLICIFFVFKMLINTISQQIFCDKIFNFKFVNY